MAVNVFNQTSERGFLKYQTLFRRIVQRTCAALNITGRVNVSAVFVDDPQIQQINRDYRNIDRTTDVISFAMHDSEEEYDYFDEEFGDIFINTDAARRQAEDYGHSLRREICFLFTHGFLHLCGFDHQTKEQEQQMIYYQKLILDDLVPQDEQ